MDRFRSTRVVAVALFFVARGIGAFTSFSIHAMKKIIFLMSSLIYN